MSSHEFSANANEVYRRSTANPSDAGVTNHGWQCAICKRRTALVAGRKRSKTCSGWICQECAK